MIKEEEKIYICNTFLSKLLFLHIKVNDRVLGDTQDETIHPGQDVDGLQAPPHYLSSTNYRDQTVDLETELKGKVQTERLTKKDKPSPGALQLLLFFQAEVLLWLSVFVGVSYTLPLL